jgi:hypothetical protein
MDCEMDTVQTPRVEQLAHIVELSRQMLEKARALEWESVAELECTRRDLVMQCFRQPVGNQDAPAVAEGIRQVLAINDELARLARAGRDQLGVEIQTHNTGRTASAAYLSCAR